MRFKSISLPQSVTILSLGTFTIIISLFFFTCKSTRNLPATDIKKTSQATSQNLPTQTPFQKPTEFMAVTKWVNAHGGLRVRQNPGRKEKSVHVLKINQRVKVINEAKKPEIIDGVNSDWYQIQVKISPKTEIIGWVFGGFLKDTPSTKLTTEDIVLFTDGCISLENGCDHCGMVEFFKNGKTEAPLQGCGEAGRLEGKWSKSRKGIIVSGKVYPSCYENCGNESPDDYARGNARAVKYEYYLDENGEITTSDFNAPPVFNENRKLYLYPREF